MDAPCQILWQLSGGLVQGAQASGLGTWPCQFCPHFALVIPIKLMFMSTECLPGTFLSIFHALSLRTVSSELQTALLPTQR